MKKIILATLLVMACYTGQIDAHVHFGIKGGVNYTNFILNDPRLTLDHSSGWQAGILLQAKFPKTGFGVQPELLYTAVKTNESDIHYFQVPVNLHQSFNLVIVRPYLQAGAYFGYYATNLDGEILKDKVDPFDWGVSLGAGLEVWKLQFGARYSWGLQDSGIKELELKNNTFSLSLAFLF